METKKTVVITYEVRSNKTSATSIYESLADAEGWVRFIGKTNPGHILEIYRVVNTVTRKAV